MRHKSSLRTLYDHHSEDIFPWLLILPTMAFLIVFCFLPMTRCFYLALTNYDRTNPRAIQFVGLANFKRIFTADKVFSKSIVISLRWVVVEVGLQLVFGMIFALVLNQNFVGRGFVRTICFAPWAVSGVLTTMLWTLIYNEHVGLLNNLLKIFGHPELCKSWVQNIHTVFGSVVVAGLWRGIPFFTITLLGGLQGIPDELYESARIDGSSAWHSFWKITLPCMKESIVFATLMRTIWVFRSVDLIMTMTNGGPVHRTLTLPIYMYQTAIEVGQYGYGSALSVVLFFILTFYVIVYLKVNKFGAEG